MRPTRHLDDTAHSNAIKTRCKMEYTVFLHQHESLYIASQIGSIRRTVAPGTGSRTPASHCVRFYHLTSSSRLW